MRAAAQQQAARGPAARLRPRVAAAAPATAVAAPATAAAAKPLPPGLAGVEFFPPPMTDQPAEMLKRRVPFLTKQAGQLPVKPESLDHALYRYSEYASKYVSVRVDNVHIKLTSWAHAVEELRSAAARGAPYWCSLLEAVRHPGWWPKEGHVPNYDQVIFGSGSASIGNHFDKDNACAGGSRRPVCTYLAMCAGRKLCLLLPPDQTLLPAGGDESLLLNPTPEFLEAVRAAGGSFFLLEDVPVTGDAAGDASGSGSGSGSEFSATALYMPSGWWHWVVGLSDWHVAFGGSLYPEVVEPPSGGAA